MKRCSECGRTYADEALTFCLDDGTLLSAPYDPQATLLISSPRTTDPNPTEVLHPQPPRFESTAQVGKPLFLYLFIALAALVVVGAVMVWLVWFKWGATDSAATSTSAPEKMSSATPSAPQLPTPTVQINISGLWRDNFGGISQITQQGDTFQLRASGVACKGRFESTGSGTINGNRIDLIYQSNYSQGQCQGTVSPDGIQMTSTCFDSACGQFQSISQRQRRSGD